MKLTKLLLKQTSNEGFTLIELLVVIIIVGILSAVALPNILNQVGRSREVEAKKNLSSLATAQQAFFFERRRFSDDIRDLGLGVQADAQYYNYEEPDTNDVNGIAQVIHVATAIEPLPNNIRDYAIGISYENRAFNVILCQGEEPTAQARPSNENLGECEEGTRIE